MPTPEALKNALSQLELSDLAISVYELIFQILNPTITLIAQKLNTNRNRVYEAIEELSKVGLIKNKQDYQRGIIPEPPQRIISKLRDKEISIRRSSEDLTKVLPDLSTIYYSNKRQPYVKIAEGRQQFIDVFNQVLEEAKEIRYFGNSEVFYDIIGFDYHLGWTKERIKKGIFAKILTTTGPRVQTLDTQTGNKLREVKILPKHYGNIDGTYYLFSNKSVHWNPVLARLIIIEDSVINNTLRANYDALWELLPEEQIRGVN